MSEEKSLPPPNPEDISAGAYSSSTTSDTPVAAPKPLGKECVGVSLVKVNLYRDFFEVVNGGMSSAVAAAITNPLDVLKIRMQVQGELQPPPGTNRSLLYDPAHPARALRAMVRADGLKALGAGAGAAVSYNFLMNGVRLGLYSTLERRGLIQHADGRVSVAASVFVSSLGGVVGAVVANPFFLVKTQLMTQSSAARAPTSQSVGFQHAHQNTLDAFRSLHSSHGLAGLYQGFSAAIPRIIGGSVSQLVSYSFIKDELEAQGVFPVDSLWTSFVGGFLSGFVVVAAVTPFDVVSVRLSNQPLDERGRGKVYRSYRDCVTKIVRSEGVSGLYKGAVPSYIRLGPQNLIQLLVWDYLNSISRDFCPEP